MDPQDSMLRLTRQAEQIILDQVRRTVSLHDPKLIAARERSLVLRCATTGWDDVVSVVIKHNKGDDARGFTDWASLAFLSTLEEARGVAPRFYAGDVRERLIVMEDLGESRSLADVLEKGNATSVVSVLEALATAMGRLVAVTVGRETTYEFIRAGLPGATDVGRRSEAAYWLGARDKIAHWADALGLSLPRTFDVVRAHIAAVYAEPGPYLAFSHGDPAPSNNHVAKGGVCLVDFEYAGYRHALYDITGWAILCPLPYTWVAAMERTFRRVLANSPIGTLIADDTQYREAWAMMCAYRALAMITWFSPNLLVEDGTWTPGWTRRAALISTTLRLHLLSAGVAALEPLAELGGTMTESLRARWPELGDGALRWPGVVDAPS